VLGFRQASLGSAAGLPLLRARELLGLWRSIRGNPERAGMAAQAACARRLLPRMARSGTTFVDVGAHIGSVVAAVLATRPEGHVVAIEAVPEKAARLRKSFPTVTVHECAVGDEQGTASFFVDPQRPGFSALAMGRDPAGTVREIPVSIRRLDDLIEDKATVDLVKIDVEGAELAVLRGARELLAAGAPKLLFESSPGGGKAIGLAPADLHAFLAECDYDIFVPNRLAHDGPPLSLEGFLESHYYPFRTLDYFAVSRSRREEIRDRARAALGIGS